MLRTRVSRVPAALCAALVLLAAACKESHQAPPKAAAPDHAAAEPPAPPSEADIPADSLGASIRRGLALFRFTPESLPMYARSNLRCTSCHQNDGRKKGAGPLIGVHLKYPSYLKRSGAVVTLSDRINYCFTRSLSGNALPHNSREMVDLLAYMAFLSKGQTMGATRKGDEQGVPPMPDTVPGDPARGGTLYAAKCVVCHQANGGGAGSIPALWGAKSYSISATMAREERAASFIFRNMPQTAPGTLTVQEAYDLAAFINSKPRNDLPGKEKDWPAGGAPADLPYATHGHEAVHPPPLLPRQNPAGAQVPIPVSVRRGAGH